jgi:hypothetical protein
MYIFELAYILTPERLWVHIPLWLEVGYKISKLRVKDVFEHIPMHILLVGVQPNSGSKGCGLTSRCDMKWEMKYQSFGHSISKVL